MAEDVISYLLKSFGPQLQAEEADQSQNIADIDKARLAAGESYDHLSAILHNVSLSSEIITAAKASAEAQNEAANKSYAATLGNNPEVATYLMNKLAADKNKADDAKAQTLEVIKQKQSVGILDNPMQWVLNRFTVNTDIDKYNNLDRQSSDAAERMLKMNHLAQAQVATNNEINAGKTAAAAVAATEYARDKAEADAVKTKIQSAEFNIGAIQAISATEHLKVSMQLQLKNLQQQEKSFQQNAELTRLNIEQLQIANERHQMDLDEAKNFEVSLATGARKLGFDIGPMKASTALKLMGTNSPQGELLQAAYQAGTFDALGGGAIAKDAGDAGKLYSMITRGESPRGPDKFAVKLLATAYDDVRAGNIVNDKGAKIAVDPKQYTEYTKVEALKRADAMSKLIDPHDGNNIYQQRDTKSLLEVNLLPGNPASPKVADLPFIRDAITPAYTAGSTATLTPTDLVKSGIRYIKTQGNGIPNNKKIEEVASGLAAMYKGAMNTNNAIMNYTSKGLPRQTSYPVELAVPWQVGWAAKRKVDMTDKVQLREYIMQSIFSAPSDL